MNEPRSRNVTTDINRLLGRNSIKQQAGTALLPGEHGRPNIRGSSSDEYSIWGTSQRKRHVGTPMQHDSWTGPLLTDGARPRRAPKGTGQSLSGLDPYNHIRIIIERLQRPSTFALLPEFALWPEQSKRRETREAARRCMASWSSAATLLLPRRARRAPHADPSTNEASGGRKKRRAFACLSRVKRGFAWDSRPQRKQDCRQQAFQVVLGARGATPCWFRLPQTTRAQGHLQPQRGSTHGPPHRVMQC